MHTRTQTHTQRYVAALRGGGQTLGQIHTRPAVRVPTHRGSTPGEYITYLLRTQSCEDQETLPVIDLYG